MSRKTWADRSLEEKWQIVREGMSPLGMISLSNPSAVRLQRNLLEHAYGNGNGWHRPWKAIGRRIGS
jgi:hypothetical protein